MCDVVRPALVLGSTQPVDDINWARVAARRMDVARRSGGGGCVVVAPGDQVWFELWLPREDPLWVDDVVKSFLWIGGAWVAALGQLGVKDLVLCTATATDDPWSRKICFAGKGPGEVLAGGRKVVGLSQRRNRLGALFHVAALVNWDAPGTFDLIASDHEVSGDEKRSGLTSLEHLAHGLGGEASGCEIEEAFLRGLPE